jgi:hypothetical protein
VDTRHGYLRIQECVLVYHSNTNGTYTQSLLSVYYRSTETPARSDSLAGSNRLELNGATKETVNCGTATFRHGQHQWCFTPTWAVPRDVHVAQGVGSITYRGITYSASSPTVRF